MAAGVDARSAPLWLGGFSGGAPGEAVVLPCTPWALHPLGVVPGGSERLHKQPRKNSQAKSVHPFLRRKDTEVRLSDKLLIF